MSARDREREPERHRWYPLPDRMPERARDRRERHQLPSRPLTDSQMDVLEDVGRFRVVAANDLAKTRYHGSREDLERDAEIMEKAGLLKRGAVPALDGPRTRVLVLTKEGRQVAERFSGDTRQHYYSGTAHANEILHDAGVYCMYQAEAAELRRHGMKVRRIVLEHELKGEVWRRVGAEEKKWGADADRQSLAASLRQRAAWQSDLKVVNGHIQFPDLRLEYERPDGERDHIDLELTTPHYRAQDIAVKRSAGMQIYNMKTPTWGVIRTPHPAAEAFGL